MILLREIAISILLMFVRIGLLVTGGILALVAKLRAMQERSGITTRRYVYDIHTPKVWPSWPHPASSILLASLVGLSIIMTWLWFVVRVMG